jgi:hypothetical protein
VGFLDFADRFVTPKKQQQYQRLTRNSVDRDARRKLVQQDIVRSAQRAAPSLALLEAMKHKQRNDDVERNSFMRNRMRMGIRGALDELNKPQAKKTPTVTPTPLPAMGQAPQPAPLPVPGYDVRREREEQRQDQLQMRRETAKKPPAAPPKPPLTKSEVPEQNLPKGVTFQKGQYHYSPSKNVHVSKGSLAEILTEVAKSKQPVTPPKPPAPTPKQAELPTRRTLDQFKTKTTYDLAEQYFRQGLRQDLAEQQAEEDVAKFLGEQRGDILTGEDEKDADLVLEMRLRYNDLLTHSKTIGEDEKWVLNQLNHEYRDELGRLGKEKKGVWADLQKAVRHSIAVPLLGTKGTEFEKLGLKSEGALGAVADFGEALTNQSGSDETYNPLGVKGPGFLNVEWKEGETLFDTYRREYSRPAAEATLPIVAQPWKQTENLINKGLDPVGLDIGHPVSGRINSELSKDVFAEVANPASIAVAIAFAPLWAARPMKLLSEGRYVAGTTRIFAELLGTGIEPDLARSGLIAIRNPKLAAQAFKDFPKNSSAVKSIMHMVDNARGASGAKRLARLEVGDGVLVRAGERIGEGGVVDAITPRGTKMVRIGNKLVEFDDEALKYSSKFLDDVLAAETRSMSYEDEIRRLMAKKGRTVEEDQWIDFAENEINEGRAFVQVPIKPPKGYAKVDFGGVQAWVKKSVGDPRDRVMKLFEYMADTMTDNPEAFAASVGRGDILDNPRYMELQRRYDVEPRTLYPQKFADIDTPENRAAVWSQIIGNEVSSPELKILRDQLEFETYSRYGVSPEEMTPQDVQKLISNAGKDEPVYPGFNFEEAPFYDVNAEIKVTYVNYIGDSAQQAEIEDAVKLFPDEVRSQEVRVTTDMSGNDGQAVLGSKALGINSRLWGNAARRTAAHELVHAFQDVIMRRFADAGLQDAFNQLYHEHFLESGMRYIDPVEAPRAVLDELQPIWEAMAGKNRPVTAYALFHRNEYQAETISTFLEDPDLVRMYDPKAYDILQEVFGRAEKVPTGISAAGGDRLLDALKTGELTGVGGGSFKSVGRSEDEAQLVTEKKTKIDDAITDARDRYGDDSTEVQSLLFRKKRGETDIEGFPPPAEGMTRSYFQGYVFDVPKSLRGKAAVDSMKQWLNEAELAKLEREAAKAQKAPRGKKISPGREVRTDVPDVQSVQNQAVMLDEAIPALEKKIADLGGEKAPWGMRQLLKDMQDASESGQRLFQAPADAPPGMRLVKYDKPTFQYVHDPAFIAAKEGKSSKAGGFSEKARRLASGSDQVEAQGFALVETTEPEWWYVSNVHKSEQNARDIIAVSHITDEAKRARALDRLQKERAMETGGGGGVIREKGTRKAKGLKTGTGTHLRKVSGEAKVVQKGKQEGQAPKRATKKRVTYEQELKDVRARLAAVDEKSNLEQVDKDLIRARVLEEMTDDELKASRLIYADEPGRRTIEVKLEDDTTEWWTVPNGWSDDRAVKSVSAQRRTEAAQKVTGKPEVTKKPGAVRRAEAPTARPAEPGEDVPEGMYKGRYNQEDWFFRMDLRTKEQRRAAARAFSELQAEATLPTEVKPLKEIIQDASDTLIQRDAAIRMSRDALEKLSDEELNRVGEIMGVVPSKSRSTLISRISREQTHIRQQVIESLSGPRVAYEKPMPPGKPSEFTKTDQLPKRTRDVLAEVRETGIREGKPPFFLDDALKEFGIEKGDKTTKQLIAELRREYNRYDRELAKARALYEEQLEQYKVNTAAAKLDDVKRPTEKQVEEALGQVEDQKPRVPKAKPTELKAKIEQQTGTKISTGKVRANTTKIEAHPNETDESIEAAATMQAAVTEIGGQRLLEWDDAMLEQLDTWSLNMAVVYYKRPLKGGRVTMVKPAKSRNGLINQIKRLQIEAGVREAPESSVVTKTPKELPTIYEDRIPQELVDEGEVAGRHSLENDDDLEKMLEADEKPARVVRKPRKDNKVTGLPEIDSAQAAVDDAAAEVQNTVRELKTGGGGGGKKKPPTAKGGGGPPEGDEPPEIEEIPREWTSTERKAITRSAAIQYRADKIRGTSEGALKGDMMRAGDRKYFDLDKDGYFKSGVEPKQQHYSLEFHDVLQTPENYVWASDEAYEHALMYRKIQRQKLEEMYEAGLIDTKQYLVWKELDYFPRNVSEIDGEDVYVGVRGGVGSKQSLLLPRAHEFVADAKAKSNGLKYIDSPATEIELYVKKVNALVANKKYGDTINKLGRTPGDRINKSYSARISQIEHHKKVLTSELKRLKNDLRMGVHKRATDVKELEKTVGTLTRRESRLAARQKGMIYGTDAYHRVGNELLETRQHLNRVKGELVSTRKSALNDARAEIQVRNAEMRVLNAQLKDAKAAKARALQVSQRPALKGEARINEPFASNRFFPKDVADAVKRDLDPMEIPFLTPLLRLIRDTNSIFTPIWATGDLSVLGIQSLTGAGMNPLAFTKAGALGFRALQDPVHYWNYVRANYDVIDEMIRHGVPIAGHELTFEQAYQLGKVGQGVEKVMRRTGLHATNDFFTRVLNVQSIELWKAGREIALNTNPGFFRDAMTESFNRVFPPTMLSGVSRGEKGLEELADVISNLTGRMSIHSQSHIGEFNKLLLGSLPFAGRYYTAWFQLLTSAVRKGGLRGAIARKALITYGLLMTGMYVAVGELIGQTPQLDPREPSTFFSYDIAGQRIGPGGVPRGLITLSAKIADDPSKTADYLAQWTLGRASPVIQTTRDLLKGETYEGYSIWDRPSDTAAYFGSMFLPFTLQSVVEELQQEQVFDRIANGENVIDVMSSVDMERLAVGAGAQATGGRSFPTPLYDQFQKEFEKTLKATYTEAEIKERETGLKYNSESPKDRDLVENTPKLKEFRDRMNDEALRKGREWAEKEKERKETIGKMEEEAGLDELASRVLAGDQVAAAQWGDAATEFLKQRAVVNKLAFQDQTDIESETETGKLVDEYFAAGDPNLYKDETGYVDWEAREAAQEEVLSRMDPMDATLLRDRDRFESTNANTVFKMRKDATAQKDVFDDQPKYQLISKDQEDDLDELVNMVEQAQTIMMLRDGKAPSKTKILGAMLKAGMGDKNLVTTAYYLNTTHLHDLAYSRARVDFLTANPELVMFYPYLYDQLRDEEKAEYLDNNPQLGPYLENRYGELEGGFGGFGAYSGAGDALSGLSTSESAWNSILREDTKGGGQKVKQSYLGPLTEADKAAQRSGAEVALGR